MEKSSQIEINLLFLSKRLSLRQVELLNIKKLIRVINHIPNNGFLS